MIKVGNNDISAIYLGNDAVSKIYLGSVEVYSASSGSPVPYEQQYFTLETSYRNSQIYWDVSNVEYSLNNGAWTTWTATTTANTITLAKGDSIRFKSSSNSTYNNKPINLKSGNWTAYGNIMSLLYGDNFQNQKTLTQNQVFDRLFLNMSGLQNAENLILPATALTNYCYAEMFKGTSITKAPVLPAATLATYCYYWMFYGCSNLNYITCLATDISATYCTKEWIYGVNATGTFVKDANMNDWTVVYNNGVPQGWTIVDA